MQAPTPLTPKDARFIALRQGLLFGIVAGCLMLLTVAGNLLLPLFSSSITYTLAFIAFFVAGWRTAKRTGRVDIGALAGFWAGVVVAILGLVAILLFSIVESQLFRTEIRLSSIVRSAVGSIPIALLALILGPAIGALGGFIGKTYAENAATASAPPAQPTSSPQPAAPAQPSSPSPQQQNQS